MAWLRCMGLVGVLAGLAVGQVREAGAQTSLPGVVVTSPNPVVPPAPPKPAPQAAAPAPKAAGSAAKAKTSASKQAAPPEPAPPAAQQPPVEALPAGAIVVDDQFVAVAVLKAEQAIARPGATVADTILEVPGIAVSSFAPGASRPIIRGLDNNRVRVQENGIGAHDVSALSEDHAVPIDPGINSQIEVVRGPATLRYGSQAIGGVVSAENNRIPQIVPPKGMSIQMRGGLSSVDDGRNGALIVDVGSGPLALHADVWRRQSGDYDTPQGRQHNSRLAAGGGAIGGSIIGPDGFIGLAWQNHTSLYHIPGVEAAERALRIDLEQWRVSSRGEWRPRAAGIEAIRYWLGYSEYKHDEISTDPGTGETSIGSTFRNKEIEGRIEAQHLPVLLAIGRLTGAVGVQWGERKLSAAGEGGELLAPTRSDTLAAFIFEELQLTRDLRLQAAFRAEQVRHRGTAAIFPESLVPPPDEPDLFAAERTFRPKSVSVGLLYQLPLGMVARLTAQQVERAPEASELFSKGPHEATQTFEIGDPRLTIERARTVEVGLRRAKGDFRFDVGAYHTTFDNFIFKRLTGVRCDDDFASCGAGTELDQIVFAQRDATFHGVEMSAELDIARIWRGVWGLSGQYDFVRARFEDGTNVPRIPPHRLGAGLYYVDPNWRARLWALHAFRQDDIADNETATSSYTLLNAELSYRWRSGSLGGLDQETLIGIRADNLLDDDVRNHVSFRKNEVLQPGRSFRLFGTITLN